MFIWSRCLSAFTLSPIGTVILTKSPSGPVAPSNPARCGAKIYSIRDIHAEAHRVTALLKKVPGVGLHIRAHRKEIRVLGRRGYAILQERINTDPLGRFRRRVEREERGDIRSNLITETESCDGEGTRDIPRFRSFPSTACQARSSCRSCFSPVSRSLEVLGSCPTSCR